MTPEQIIEADNRLAEMNAQDKAMQHAIVDAEADVAAKQKAAADAVNAVKLSAADRDVLIATRNKLKAEYGRLHEQVGIAKKARAEAKAKETAEATAEG